MITNSFHALSPDKPRWEKTPDGFLRCKARVLAERVMPYGREELAEVPDTHTAPTVNMLVERTSMCSADSLRSLEGAAVVAGDHMWVTPEIIKQYGVGHVAGTPTVDGPYLVCDLVITDQKAIEDIENEKIGEISAAYTADAVFEPGEYDGEKYDAKQVKLRYNHIAVIPTGHGRAGSDIRIINNKPKEMDMAEEKKVRVRLGNTGRFVNTDEEGAAAIAEEEKIVNQEVEGSGKKLEDLMTELEAAKAAAAEANAQCEELKGELSVYKEKLDALLSTEAIEHAAMGMVAEQAEAEEILENSVLMNEGGKEMEEEEKKAFSNSIRSLHGPKLHHAVLAACGVRCENMSPEALRGAFKAQNQILKAGGGQKKVVAGAKMFNTGGGSTPGVPAQRTSMERLGFGKK